MNLGHWINKTDEEYNTSKYGFIYRITNTATNRMYIGKKQCLSKRKKPPLKGKKNKRHVEVETDWKNYTSSSTNVNEDIIKYGKENFCFEIIRWCDSKFELAYFEAKLQFEEEVLLSENYYNGIINLRISKPKNYGTRISCQ